MFDEQERMNKMWDVFLSRQSEYFAKQDDHNERYASERADLKAYEESEAWEHERLNKIYLKHLELAEHYDV